jgi:formamidase
MFLAFVPFCWLYVQCAKRPVLTLLVLFFVVVVVAAVAHSTDATIAYKRAVLNCIKYLAKFGYTEQQVYLLLSCIPCEGRISGIVDVPNAVATLAIPLAIFDRDIRPTTMSKLEQLAQGIRLLETNVCMSSEGGAVPNDPRLD